MKIQYGNSKVKLQCTNLNAALDENEQPYDPCYIDEIAAIVKIVEIREVSAHYE